MSALGVIGVPTTKQQARTLLLSGIVLLVVAITVAMRTSLPWLAVVLAVIGVVELAFVGWWASRRSHTDQ